MADAGLLKEFSKFKSKGNELRSGRKPALPAAIQAGCDAVAGR